jgi:large subunit ribosomal protein L4
MRVKALYSVLSQKLKDNEILFIDSVAFAKPKTSEAKMILSSLATLSGFEDLATKKKNAVLLTLPKKDEMVFKSFRNMGNVSLHEVRNLNPVDVLSSKYLIISDPSLAISVLEAKRALMEKKKVSRVSGKKVVKKVSTKKVLAKKPVTVKKKTVSKKAAKTKSK